MPWATASKSCPAGDRASVAHAENTASSARVAPANASHEDFARPVVGFIGGSSSSVSLPQFRLLIAQSGGRRLSQAGAPGETPG